ncbi:unnamed protein product [Vicia faba]|uniref:Uncharacterized protein n=1 Tax=Vicia faba TaxID=3906 RepID=A0AAV1AX54_VICFA|nr:unnamed protein product [Vicia faba]
MEIEENVVENSCDCREVKNVLLMGNFLENNFEPVLEQFESMDSSKFSILMRQGCDMFRVLIMKNVDLIERTKVRNMKTMDFSMEET